jgi:hypothetical protein
MLQVARFILKSLNRVQRGGFKPVGDSIQYLTFLVNDHSFILDTDDL